MADSVQAAVCRRQGAVDGIGRSPPIPTIGSSLPLYAGFPAETSVGFSNSYTLFSAHLTQGSGRVQVFLESHLVHSEYYAQAAFRVRPQSGLHQQPTCRPGLTQTLCVESHSLFSCPEYQAARIGESSDGSMGDSGPRAQHQGSQRCAGDRGLAVGIMKSDRFRILVNTAVLHIEVTQAVSHAGQFIQVSRPHTRLRGEATEMRPHPNDLLGPMPSFSARRNWPA